MPPTFSFMMPPENKKDVATKAKAKAAEPMVAELKYLDRKYNHSTSRFYYSETVIAPITPTPEQIDWWQKVAMCITRHLNIQDEDKVEEVVVQINSPYLIKMLRNVVGKYPGLNFGAKPVVIPVPSYVLYHYGEELKRYAETIDTGSTASDHIKLLLDRIETEHGGTIQETKDLQEQGLISYDHLWTIFKPGSVVFGRHCNQLQAFSVLNYKYCSTPGSSLFEIHLSYVDFDGNRFGLRDSKRTIFKFNRNQLIHTLSVVPYAFQPDVESVKSELLDRGRRFEGFAGMHFADHSGIALEGRSGQVHVDSRVVVDCATFHRINANSAFKVTRFGGDQLKTRKDTYRYVDFPTSTCGTFASRRFTQPSCGVYDVDDSTYAVPQSDIESQPKPKVELSPLSDEQCLLATSQVRGFSFDEKKWFDFSIDNLSPIEWNEKCFNQLVLPQGSKKLVQALVTEHVNNKSDFDDIVKGKGRGLVMMLHGPPGVGKTLTAECVAEHCKRPLYVVSSGDLGTDANTLDQILSRILDLASTWRAVLLIDEADVFLESRSIHDMERNALVSIFLRVLEYYQGIMFLTTNRVNTFDEAFKSRIHVPLKYTCLDASSRKQIWNNFLSKTNGEFSDEALDSLATHDLNGRQIKGIVKTATSLAHYDEKPLDVEALEQVIAIQIEFEKDLSMK